MPIKLVQHTYKLIQKYSVGNNCLRNYGTSFRPKERITVTIVYPSFHKCIADSAASILVILQISQCSHEFFKHVFHKNL